MTNVRGSWNDQEDKRLFYLVKNYRNNHINEPISWAIISHQMRTRTAKQCRERWINHLNETINKSPLSEDEERRILQMHRQKPELTYVQISEMLPGRTPLIVKNFIYRNNFKKPKSALRIRRRMRLSYVLN
ncbi:Homeodomain-like protein [Glomus cerebriforme]|uniref:Homeodomain-like protein n=1 Tax=Glomus cerebriforme TaxID=658196 RepID=A0A397TCP2_9GLOM|nr:Homeodomain-like protein [Glomus cerebriforme]